MTYEEAQGWTTLADPNRRAILMQLAEGERTVSELTETLPVSQPAVSQHLKVLKHVGLVSDRAEGTRRIYRLNEPGLWRCATSSTRSGSGRCPASNS
jgi:DNA-binding transcriptional ArsR family regulator